ncbi:MULTISPECIES: K(+)-transporting ATPase subunit F [Providencia]
MLLLVYLVYALLSAEDF